MVEHGSESVGADERLKLYSRVKLPRVQVFEPVDMEIRTEPKVAPLKIGGGV